LPLFFEVKLPPVNPMSKPRLIPTLTFASACALAAVLGNLPVSAQAGDLPAFAARRVFNAGSYPFALAVGDFNKDGILDVAAAGGSYPGGVSVLLGNGNGTFQPAVTYTNAPFLNRITATDLNHDTNLDLIANGLSQGAWVMLGNGNGTFQPAKQIPGPGGAALAFGSFNGDVYPDLVYINFGTDGVVMATNKGNGTFQMSGNYYTSAISPAFVAVQDMNNDGRADIVAADVGSVGIQPGGVSVLLGKGGGAFQFPTNTFVGTNDQFLAIGDFNHDLTNDVAVTDYGSGTVILLLGRGDGTFTNKAAYTVGAQAGPVAVGDFNGDGTNDLVVAAATNAAVLLGNGDGTFQTPTRYDWAKLDVAIGDFNADGKPDLAVCSLNNTTSIGVMPGNGDGTFQAAPHYPAGSNPRFLALGDLNGDNRPELVVANSGTNNISVLLNKGDGTFQPRTNYVTGTNPASLAIADFRGVGTNDVAVANQNSNAVSFLRGNGNGTLQPTATAGSVQFGTSYVLAGDFNNDHKLDIAALGLLGISLFPGNGNGTFQAAVATSGPAELDQLAAGDFNGDGTNDLVFDNYGGNVVSVMRGNGNGSFQAPVTYPAGTNVQSVAVGDFNGDGTNDLAVGSEGAAYPPNGVVAILLDKGDGTFRSFTNYLTGWFVSAAVADFNADGKADLAAVDGGANQVDVMLGNGDGTFQPASAFAVENGATFVGAGDLNGDGLPDLAVVNAASANVSVLLNTHVSAGPALAVSLVNAVNQTIALSWPVSATDYLLESVTNLASANWESSAGSQTSSNGTVNVTVPIGAGTHFFRLHKQ
jgi:hypothetical protein